MGLGRFTPYAADFAVISLLFISYQWIAGLIVKWGLTITFNYTLYTYLVFIVLFYIYKFGIYKWAVRWT